MQDQWAIVLATFLGPIAAIAISLWREQRTRVREPRLRIFRTLMATRRVAISQDHVNTLNQVEVEFYGDSAVIAAWKAYVAHLNVRLRPDATEQDQKEWERRRNGHLAVLLAAIGKSLGFKIGEVEIQEGGYAPEGWQLRDLAQQKALTYLADLSDAKKVLPVFIVQPQPPQPATTPS